MESLIFSINNKSNIIHNVEDNPPKKEMDIILRSVLFSLKKHKRIAVVNDEGIKTTTHRIGGSIIIVNISLVFTSPMMELFCMTSNKILPIEKRDSKQPEIHGESRNPIITFLQG